MALTDEQIENWRTALCHFLGPYALIMPRAQIEQMKERFQHKVNQLDEQYQEEMAELPFSEGDKVKVKGRGNAVIKHLGPTQSKVRWAWGGQTFVNNDMIEEL